MEILKSKGTVTQLYNQGKLNYSLLVKYSIYDGHVYAVSKLIPHVTEMIKIINRFSLFIFSIALVVIVLLIVFLTKKITKPLSQLTCLSKDISNMNFNQITIQSHDEIGELANAFNTMSAALKKAHYDLENKNKHMKDLLSNVSHEIKTPVALIKAYLTGIQDGLDDGTFLDTIYSQNEGINEMVELLISISSIETTDLKIQKFSFSKLIYDLLPIYTVLLNENGIKLTIDIKEECMIEADYEKMKSVVSNFITNAIKYTSNNQIHITLFQQKFSITNGCKNDIQINEIWQPFYVGESSRNKLLSGSGLGLSIVKAILDKHQFEYKCSKDKNEITFTIYFQKK